MCQNKDIAHTGRSLHSAEHLHSPQVDSLGTLRLLLCDAGHRMAAFAWPSLLATSLQTEKRNQESSLDSAIKSLIFLAKPAPGRKVPYQWIPE